MWLRREIPWGRIFAEGAIIVVSILLAFWIDAWWQSRQTADEEQLVLSALHAEFRANIERIDDELRYHRAVNASIEQLFDAANGRSELSADVLDELIGDITWWGVSEFESSASQSVIQSGGLSVIQNRELRQLVAKIPSIYQTGYRAQRQDEQTARQVVLPYLTSRAFLPQIANTMAEGRPGLGQSPTPPVYPVVESRDHAQLLQDPEFLGVLVREHWDHMDGITWLENIRQVLDRAVDLIELDSSD